MTTDGRIFATTAGTDRGFSWEVTVLAPGSAHKEDTVDSIRKQHRRHIRRGERKMDMRLIVIGGPIVAYRCGKWKSINKKGARIAPRPLCDSRAGLLYGGKHFFDGGRF